ncbi:MAG: spermidine/putrescine ABC transporter permease PotB [Arsenophonus endosymbiont of Ceratovacuna japonica]
MMNNNYKVFNKIIIISLILWLFLFAFLPNLIIIIISFLTKNDTNLVDIIFTLDNYIKLFNKLYIKVMYNSLNISIIATLCCLIIGYPLAFCLTRLSVKLQPLMLFLLIIPFWTNSLIRIYGLKIFLSTNGYLNYFLIWIGLIDKPIHIIYTKEGVIIGLIYIFLPFMVMPLYTSIKKLDKSYLEAAQDLGANKLKIFFYIIIPLTMPDIIAGCLLVLLPAIGLFYVSDLMGGAKNLLIGNIIKSQFFDLHDWPFGAATSIVLTIIMGLLLYIYYYTLNLLNNKIHLI